jgi:hypothetical protein
MEKEVKMAEARYLNRYQEAALINLVEKEIERCRKDSPKITFYEGIKRILTESVFGSEESQINIKVIVE